MIESGLTLVKQHTIGKGSFVRCESSSKSNPYSKLMDCEIRKHASKSGTSFNITPLGTIGVAGITLRNGAVSFGSMGKGDVSFNYHDASSDEDVTCRVYTYDDLRGYNKLMCQ